MIIIQLDNHTNYLLDLKLVNSQRNSLRRTTQNVHTRFCLKEPGTSSSNTYSAKRWATEIDKHSNVFPFLF